MKEDGSLSQLGTRENEGEKGQASSVCQCGTGSDPRHNCNMPRRTPNWDRIQFEATARALRDPRFHVVGDVLMIPFQTSTDKKGRIVLTLRGTDSVCLLWCGTRGKCHHTAQVCVPELELQGLPPGPSARHPTPHHDPNNNLKP